MVRWLVIVSAIVACKQQPHASLNKRGDSEAEFAALLNTALGKDLVFDEAKHQLIGSNEMISTTNLYADWKKKFGKADSPSTATITTPTRSAWATTCSSRSL
jgi:hypothetical protein